MFSKVKSEQHFVTTNTNRVTVFQASLKLVREETGTQLSYKDNKCSTSHDQNV